MGYDKLKHQVWNMMEPDLCLENGGLPMDNREKSWM
jgi:hypothetical protein